MNQLLNRLRDEKFSLLVSLPRNDVRLAQAALRGGAQGLKIHINVHHHASGTHFGSFEAEQPEIARILDAASGVPVGIVPGGDPFATLEEFAELARMDVDFFDAYPGDAPAWTLHQDHLDKMLAAYEGGTTQSMIALAECGMTMCEASILGHEAYGKPLAALDLARYAELARALPVPVIVPSQKRIVPDEVPLLKKTGVKGVLIGAIVTGREPESLESATRAFREQMDAD